MMRLGTPVARFSNWSWRRGVTPVPVSSLQDLPELWSDGRGAQLSLCRSYTTEQEAVCVEQLERRLTQFLNQLPPGERAARTLSADHFFNWFMRQPGLTEDELSWGATARNGSFPEQMAVQRRLETLRFEWLVDRCATVSEGSRPGDDVLVYLHPEHVWTGGLFATDSEAPRRSAILFPCPTGARVAAIADRDLWIIRSLGVRPLFVQQLLLGRDRSEQQRVIAVLSRLRELQLAAWESSLPHDSNSTWAAG